VPAQGVDVIAIRDQFREVKRSVSDLRKEVSELELQAEALDTEGADREASLNTIARLKGLVRSSLSTSAPRFDVAELALAPPSADARLAAQDQLLNLRVQSQILNERKRRLTAETTRLRRELSDLGIDGSGDVLAAQDKQQKSLFSLHAQLDDQRSAQQSQLRQHADAVTELRSVRSLAEANLEAELRALVLLRAEHETCAQRCKVLEAKIRVLRSRILAQERSAGVR